MRNEKLMETIRQEAVDLAWHAVGALNTVDGPHVVIDDDFWMTTNDKPVDPVERRRVYTAAAFVNGALTPVLVHGVPAYLLAQGTLRERLSGLTTLEGLGDDALHRLHRVVDGLRRDDALRTYVAAQRLAAEDADPTGEVRLSTLSTAPQAERAVSLAREALGVSTQVVDWGELDEQMVRLRSLAGDLLRVLEPRLVNDQVVELPTTAKALGELMGTEVSAYLAQVLPRAVLFTPGAELLPVRIGRRLGVRRPSGGLAAGLASLAGVGAGAFVHLRRPQIERVLSLPLEPLERLRLLIAADRLVGQQMHGGWATVPRRPLQLVTMCLDTGTLVDQLTSAGIIEQRANGGYRVVPAGRLPAPTPAVDCADLERRLVDLEARCTTLRARLVDDLTTVDQMLSALRGRG